MKDIIIAILHLLFVLSLYALSAINLFASVPTQNTYNLAMAILLYIIAIKHEKSFLEESEVEDGKID